MVSQDSYLSHAVADRQAAGSGSDITLSNRLLANRLNTAIALLVAFLLPRQKRVSRFPLSTTRVKSSELIIRLVSPLSSLFTQCHVSEKLQRLIVTGVGVLICVV